MNGQKDQEQIGSSFWFPSEAEHVTLRSPSAYMIATASVLYSTSDNLFLEFYKQGFISESKCGSRGGCISSVLNLKQRVVSFSNMGVSNLRDFSQIVNYQCIS